VCGECEVELWLVCRAAPAGPSRAAESLEVLCCRHARLRLRWNAAPATPARQHFARSPIRPAAMVIANVLRPADLHSRHSRHRAAPAANQQQISGKSCSMQCRYGRTSQAGVELTNGLESTIKAVKPAPKERARGIALRHMLAMMLSRPAHLRAIQQHCRRERVHRSVPPAAGRRAGGTAPHQQSNAFRFPSHALPRIAVGQPPRHTLLQ